MDFSADDKIAMMEAASTLTVDTEGVPMVGFSIAFDGMLQGFYLPFNHAKDNLSPKQQQKALQVLDSREALVFHNAAHDLKILTQAGLDYRGFFWDTMLMAHWVNEERFNYSLDSISKVYGGEPKAMPPQMQAIIESDGWAAVPVPWMDEYSSNDSLITHKLFNKLKTHFVATEFNPKPEFPIELWEREQVFIRDVMIPMMGLGIKVDTAFCIREYMRGQAIMKECVEELGFKPSSPKALEKFLIDELGLPVVKHTKACKKCNPVDRRQKSLPVRTHKAKPSFDKDAMKDYDVLLEKTGDVRAKTILRYRGWQKTNSSNYKPYMELIDHESVLHPGYKLHGTRTSRLSCELPNLQQIPKSSDKDWNGNLKSAFVAREGYSLWTVDYSQLQFRMTCAYAKCYVLLGIFNDATRDIFSEMAAQMGWLRDDVKTLVYLILFGGGAGRAAVAFGVSVEEGGELVNEFHSLYPEIRAVAKQAERAAMRQGYVSLWTGRRRHFPKGSSFYRAFNAVIQGGEAEIIKSAMIALATNLCDEKCRMVLQIHDEIAFEIKDGMEEHYISRAQKIMEDAGKAFCEYVGTEVVFRTSAKRWGEK